MPDTLTEDLRLLILRCLDELPQDEAVNNSIVYKEVKRWGHPCYRDQFDAAVQWLIDQRTLIVAEPVERGSLKKLRLLDFGHSVAMGRPYPGIAQPTRRHD